MSQNIREIPLISRLSKPNIKTLAVTVFVWIVISISMLTSFGVFYIMWIAKMLDITTQTKLNRVNDIVGMSMITNILTWCNIWSINVVGNINISPYDQYIIISNHPSFSDSIFLSYIPLSKKFIMAREYSGIPVFGWICRQSDFVMVDDRDKTTTSNAVSTACKAMTDGSSMVIFPEGKRSKTENTVLPFKTGAFRLSARTNIPILPIVLKGTSTAIGFGGLCKPADIEIIIGEPYYVNNTNMEQCVEQSHKYIQSKLR